MPPKPWQTRKKPVQNISQIIQSNPTIKQQVPKLPPSITATEIINNANSGVGSLTNPTGNPITGTTTATAAATGLGATTGTGLGTYGSGYGSGYGGLGSSYGGYGGYGGYGSSYGGYGMGSMYGMGGMYGMGRYGIMGQDKKGFLFNTMITLDSFSYLINCLCEIAGSLDRNAEGLSLFYKSFKNLIKRLENSVINGFKWVITKIKNFFLAIFRFIVQNIFFMRQDKTKSKYRALKMVFTAAITCFLVSMYPLVRKAIKNY